MLGLSRIQQNPFAIKTTTPTRSVADSTENKETKPIVAPPTLVLGADNACAVSSSGSRIVLRPSALAFQAEKLKQASSDAGSSESKEGASATATTKDPQQQQQSSKDPREVSSTCESSGSPVTNGGGGRTTGRASAESVVEDDNSGSATASSSGRNNSSSGGGAEGTSGFGSALVDLRNGTSSSEHATAGLGGGSAFLSSAADDAIHSPPAPPDGFVFGQNLRERAANFDDGSSDSSVPSSTELSFQRFQQAGQSSAGDAAAEQPADLSSSAASRHAKSLTESAEEYQSRQVKRTYDEVAVVTGEENESNVLQINCKLFTFDKGTASWHERGRGNLRLNDQEVDGALQSRMVMRTQGSLRVILNTKVWAGMVVEHPSPKTVRTTATDPDGIRVYLIQANPKDAEQLYSALECRVASLKSAEDSTSPLPTLATQGLPPSADSSSSFPESAGSAEEEGAPRAKRPRLQESDGSSLPDSSHGEEDSIPTAECESSAEDKG